MSTDLMPVTVTPMTLIERAASQNASIEQMQQLFELKLRVEADEARKAFNEAFTAFKAETIRIVRDKENAQYSKPNKPAMYVSLENMVATVTPFLSKHGLSHSWEIQQAVANSQVTVTCILTHVLGHSNQVSISAPPDTSGAKNGLQQVKSTLTYLKVSTFESICGLASEFGGLSDDGNAADRPQTAQMDPDDLRHYIEQIAEAGDRDELKRIYTAGYTNAKAAGDVAAQRELIKAKDARLKVLG